MSSYILKKNGNEMSDTKGCADTAVVAKFYFYHTNFSLLRVNIGVG